ncbi:DUF4124 domain-containing protein [Solimonas marina]|uniref:DUF4124 domain-containing protein n=1 Tax=Solimonas marina TaxID=2714601 RepID=A0A969W8L2_9GAMM|nr:DUF4124 domain-containing protein [Solimonas marina]NKF21988.1 DUF4124 domain-containing protein [Solimonas marina]
MLFAVGLALTATFVATAGEPVYRYIDADGVVHYTDRAPERNARPLKLEAPSGTTPSRPPAFYSAEALREAARFAVRIESPTPGERDVEAHGAVAAASVMPGLVSGFHLVYQLDGKSLSPQPVDDLSVSMGALAPGRHTLVVVLLDDRGAERARSVPAVFDVPSASLANNAPR